MSDLLSLFVAFALPIIIPVLILHFAGLVAFGSLGIITKFQLNCFVASGIVVAVTFGVLALITLLMNYFTGSNAWTFLVMMPVAPIGFILEMTFGNIVNWLFVVVGMVFVLGTVVLGYICSNMQKRALVNDRSHR